MGLHEPADAARGGRGKFASVRRRDPRASGSCVACTSAVVPGWGRKMPGLAQVAASFFLHGIPAFSDSPVLDPIFPAVG